MIRTERTKLPGHPTRDRQRAPGCLVPLGLVIGIAGLLAFGIGMDWLDFGRPRGDENRWILSWAGALFVAAGLFLAGLTLVSRFREERERDWRSDDSERPWLGDASWDPAGRTHRPLFDSVGPLLKALFFTALLTPVNIEYFPHPLVLLADALLLYPWSRFARPLVRSGRFGRSRLRYVGFPFFLGEPLAVYLEDIDRLKGLRRLRLTLRCVEEVEEADVEGTPLVQPYALWTDERVLTPEEVPFGEGSPSGFFSLARHEDVSAALRFEARLPDDPRLSTRLASLRRRYWELAVWADPPGLDYTATFRLPVYAKVAPEETAGDRSAKSAPQRQPG